MVAVDHVHLQAVVAALDHVHLQAVVAAEEVADVLRMHTTFARRNTFAMSEAMGRRQNCLEDRQEAVCSRDCRVLRYVTSSNASKNLISNVMTITMTTST